MNDVFGVDGGEDAFALSGKRCGITLSVIENFEHWEMTVGKPIGVMNVNDDFFAWVDAGEKLDGQIHVVIQVKMKDIGFLI